MLKHFGQQIRKARKEKRYSQRALAKLAGIDFTYLSKLENNRADYAPKEEVIRNLSKYLDLDSEELIFLTGRIPERFTSDEGFLSQTYKAMPALFRIMEGNPTYVYRILGETIREEDG